MKSRRHFISFRPTHVALVLLTAAVSVLAVRVFALEGAQPRAAATTAFTFQGRAIADGIPASGACDFTFRLFDSLEAGSQVGPAVGRPAVPVANGLFTAQLDFGSVPFENGEKRFLATTMRCPADDGSGGGPLVDLAPRQELTATPYAIYAQHVPFSGILGLPPSLGGDWQNVVIVAKSGGDFSTIQAALDSITTATPSNPFLVWVAPGVYEERVSIPSNVTLRGAGKHLVTIRSSGSATATNSATVSMPTKTALADITIENTGGNTYAGGIRVTGASDIDVEVRISDVHVNCLADGGCIGLEARAVVIDVQRISMLVYTPFPATSSGHGIGVLLTGSPGVYGAFRDADIYVERYSNATQAVAVRIDNGSSVSFTGGRVRANSETASTGISTLTENRLTLRDLSVDASGPDSSSSVIAVLALSSGPLDVDGLTITATGSMKPRGISISGGGGSIRNTRIDAFGSNVPIGIEYASLTRILEIVSVDIGTGGYQVAFGIAAVAGDTTQSVVHVKQTSVSSQLHAISANNGQTFRVADSLVSSRSGTGTFICVGVYNEFFVAKNAACL